MEYVVRVLGSNGKLTQERIMFHAVRILDRNGKLKKVVKSKILSEMYWKESLSCSSIRNKSKKKINTYKKKNNSCVSLGK